MRALLLSSALLVAAPAFAQQPGVAAPEAVQAAPVERNVDEIPVNQLIIFEGDTCPQSEEVINICVVLDEDDRFRIPENLRENPNDPDNESWANRAIALSYVGRTGTESCSTVGGGGFTGCLNQVIRQARAERANSEEVNWNRLVEEARQERLSRIDEAAQAEEDAENTPD
jgi:hypothetical protein